MNKRDTGVEWLGVPVFIVDESPNRIDIVTNDRDDLDHPEFIVGEAYFNDVQANFGSHRVALDYMIRQFKRGKIDPLNKAAEEAEENRE